MLLYDVVLSKKHLKIIFGQDHVQTYDCFKRMKPLLKVKCNKIYEILQKSSLPNQRKDYFWWFLLNFLFLKD